MDAEVNLNVLQQLVSQPTAPFREERVAGRIAAFLRVWGIEFEVDEFGNIVAHYQRGPQSRPLVLMAHMDHPAFVITAMAGPDAADMTAMLLGGVSPHCFERPVAVKLFPRSRAQAEPGLPAHIVGFKQGALLRDVELYIKLDNATDAAAIAVEDFGIWDLPDFELRDGFVHARVIDDLVGCAATLATLLELSQAQAEANVYGVFTRAEEVGLVGATAILNSGKLPKEAIVISLEASKTLPGAVQGEGPVIRVGDRSFTFSDEGEFVLRAAAQELNKAVVPGQPPIYKIQRQLMSGGGCEAGAALVAGYVATGLAFPLGNYHNVTEDFRLEPENIHEYDYTTGIALLQATARLMPQLEQLRAAQLQSYTNKDAMTTQLKDTATHIQKAIIVQ